VPGGKLLACEPCAPRGIIGSQGAVVFLEEGDSVGRLNGRPEVFLVATS